MVCLLPGCANRAVHTEASPAVREARAARSAPATASEGSQPPSGAPLGFAFDGAELTEPMRRSLAPRIRWLVSHPATPVLIVGVGDGHRAPEIENALGERRAAAVRDALAQAGVAPARVKVQVRSDADAMPASDASTLVIEAIGRRW